MPVKRSMGVFSLFLFSMGSVVGSAWLLGPFVCAQMAGPSAVLAWLIGGFLMLFVGLTFAELGCMFPVVGSSTRYLQWSHGTLVSFTFAWVAWISSVAITPIETLAILQYAYHYIPWLMFEKNGVYLLTRDGRWIAFGLMALMCFINNAGTRWLSVSSAWISVWKLLIPSITIVLLVSLHFHSSNFTDYSFFSGGGQGMLASLPSGGIIAALMGYTAATQMAGEIKQPQKNIPRVIMLTILVSTLLYAGLQMAFIGAMPESALTSGWTHLHYPGDSGPFIGLLTLLGIFWFVKVLYVDVFVSPFGAGLAYTGIAARLIYAMGDNGYLPRFLHKLNKNGVPGRLIIVDFLIGLLFFFPFPTWQEMMSFLVSCSVLAYAVGPLALMVLRKKMPDHPRPFRLAYAAPMSFIAFYVCNLILVWAGWAIIYKMLIMVVISYFVLALLRYSCAESKKIPLGWNNSFWLFFYFVAIGITSYLSSFGGGKNILTFGWDFAVIFVESLIVFVWSQRCHHCK